MGKKQGSITVGYFDLQGKKFISGTVINDAFIKLLVRYVRLIIIPVNKKKDIKDSFSKLEKYKLDYLYVDSYNFLLESFLSREKLDLDIPFIVALHTVFPWRKRYIYSTPLIRKYDIIYAPSRYAKESFLKISDKFDIHVIPNCLNTHSIQNGVPHGFKNGIKIITFMGRLVAEKGIGILIKCMPEIITKAGNVHLNIIGPLSGGGLKDRPKSKYVRKTEKMVNQLKLTSRVHFKGVQLGLDKYRILSESSVFVNPTTASEEAFPVTNIEALACGVPVIATNWAGNSELIRHGKNGFLIDVNYDQDKNPQINIKQLISAVLRILKNKQLRHKMRRSALAGIRYYDSSRILPQLVRLLKKKTQLRHKKRWNLIKNKTVIDFRTSFNKNFFFFLNFDISFRKKTYAILYRDIFSIPSYKRRKYLRTIKRRVRFKNRYSTISKELRQNLRDVLLLKTN